MKTQLSRRTLLRGVGASIALPWFEAMASAATCVAGTAQGTLPTAPPVRMAFLYVPNGIIMSDWKPPKHPDHRLVLAKTFEPVKAFQDKMNVLTGLALHNAQALGDGGGDHARSVASFLTGAHPRKTEGDNIHNGKSVDQVAAEAIGHLTRLKSLELGTERSAVGGRCDSGYSCVYTSNMSWRNATSPLPKEIDPASIFQRLFGSEEERQNREAFHRRQRHRKSILDHVRGEANQLSHSLGAHDRRKLDEYLYAVRDLERRIQRTDQLETPETDIPDFPRPKGVPQEWGEHVKLLMDMLVLAFQTDTTRICSFMFTNAGSNRSYRNLSIRPGHHSLSHHKGSQTKQDMLRKINRYHMSLVAHLLQRLDAISEGDGTLLDHCMILYGSGISDGNRHSHSDLPIALFGGGGGTIATGRHIACRPDTPLTNLYRSMLQRIGAPVERFSDSNGLIEELSQA